MVSVSALAVTVAACGLAIVGDAEDEGTLPDESPDAAVVVDGDGASPADPPPDGSPEPDTGPPPCDPNACTPPTAAPGFELVLFGDADVACPADFAATDVVTDPVAGLGACTCGPCAAQVSCSKGTIRTLNGHSTCTSPGSARKANDGACTNMKPANWGGTLGSVEPPEPEIGACSAPGVATPSAVTKTGKRLCAPSAAACKTTACSPPAGLTACFVADGNVGCPAQAPTKHLVGSDAQLECSNCGCDVTATCSGTFETFGSPGCGGTRVVVTSSTCTPTNGARAESYRWTGVVAATSCTSTAPPPVVTLEGERTVCCPL